jgi:hypothetical protein
MTTAEQTNMGLPSVDEINRIIGEWDGAKIINETDYNFMVYRWENREQVDCYLSQFRYHESWDWLMPVVEKIESVHIEAHGRFGVYICSNNCTIQGSKFNSEKRSDAYYFDIYSVTKIHATWLAVKEFIIWHNAYITQNTHQ